MTQYATYVLRSRDYVKYQPVEVLSILDAQPGETQVRRLHDNSVAWVRTNSLRYPDEEVPL